MRCLMVSSPFRFRRPLPASGAATAALLLLALLAAMPHFMRVAAQQSGMPPPGSPDRPYLIPEANRLPDANDQMVMREQAAKAQSFDAANAERRRQLLDDSARLLKLATELKLEVDKTTKDTLSVTVIRKADEIERLAHGVKEKMKLQVGAAPR